MGSEAFAQHWCWTSLMPSWLNGGLIPAARFQKSRGEPSQRSGICYSSRLMRHSTATCGCKACNVCLTSTERVSSLNSASIFGPLREKQMRPGVNSSKNAKRDDCTWHKAHFDKGNSQRNLSNTSVVSSTVRNPVAVFVVFFLVLTKSNYFRVAATLILNLHHEPVVCQQT